MAAVVAPPVSSLAHITDELPPVKNDARTLPTGLRGSLSAHGLDDVLNFFSTIQNATSTTFSPPSAQSQARIGPSTRQKATSTSVTATTTPQPPTLRAPTAAEPTPTTAPSASSSRTACPGSISRTSTSQAFGYLSPAMPPWCWLDGVPWCSVEAISRRPRHRVRRVLGVRRLSAVLFAAPEWDVKLMPLEGVQAVRKFSGMIEKGEVSVGWFKEVMGKRWRWREGNEVLGQGENGLEQDAEIERLIWG